eukprot:c21818_g1_i1.p1 GENE.c21818_g1_i1~~c21818_g1_i1.p1  ORF type:complete len:747 (-),score=163.22 c21818_g1_i1:23-2263(-)
MKKTYHPISYKSHLLNNKKSDIVNFQKSNYKSELPCANTGLFAFGFPFICANEKLLAVVYTSYPSFNFSSITDDVFAIVLAEIQNPVTIPTTIGQFTNLMWLVGVSALSGQIPSEIGQLTSLNIMIFPNNRAMSTTIPSQIGKLSQLSMIDIHNIYAYNSIPTQIAQLANLTYIDFGSNSLSGILPSEFERLQSLSSFIVWNSNINVSNFDFTLWSQLQDLDISGTQIVKFPYSILSLTQLTALDVGRGGIVSTIPSQISLLSQLNELILTRNEFYLTIPSEIGLLSLITYLDLAYNKINGTIITEFNQLSQLKSLILSENQLSGTIPEALFDLGELQLLYLDGNLLTGTISSEIGKLTSLTRLRIENNQLSGSIPISMLSLPFRSIEFYGNRFHSTIPTQIGLLTELNLLQLGSNFFSGNIPTQISLIKGLNYLAILHNNFTGTIPPLPSTINLLCDYSGIVGDSRCAYYVKDQGDYLEDSVFAIAVSFSAAISLIIILTILLFIWKRRHMAIVVSGLAFNLLTLIGLLCIVISVIPFGLTMSNSVSVRDTECKVTPILFVFGTIMVFSTISARNYPIWKMYDPTSTEKMVLPKIDVIRPVGVIVIAAVTVISIYAYENKGAYLNSGCRYDGSNQEILLTIVGALGILTSLFASYSSFAVRDAIFDYSDAKQVMIATFNILTFGAALTILGLTSDTAASKFLSVSFSAILGVITFFVLVHGTKIKTILTDHTKLGRTNSVEIYTT